jgi:hypothetical protein
MKWYTFHNVPLFLTEESVKLLRQVEACEPMDGMSQLLKPRAETITESQIQSWLDTVKNGEINMSKLFEYM